MPTTYPYGPKGAPVVGNGLGGLPRRVDPTPAPAPAPVTLTPRLTAGMNANFDRGFGWRVPYNGVLNGIVGSYTASGNYSSTIQAVMNNYPFFTINTQSGGNAARWPAGYSTHSALQDGFVSQTFGGESNYSTYTYIYGFASDYLYVARSISTSSSVYQGFIVDAGASAFYCISNTGVAKISKSSLTAEVSFIYSGTGSIFAAWVNETELCLFTVSAGIVRVNKDTLQVISASNISGSYPISGVWGGKLAQTSTTIGFVSSDNYTVYVIDKATSNVRSFSIPYSFGSTRNAFLFTCNDKLTLITYDYDYNSYINQGRCYQFSATQSFNMFYVSGNSWDEAKAAATGCFFGPSILTFGKLNPSPTFGPTGLGDWSVDLAGNLSSISIPSFSSVSISYQGGGASNLSTVSTSSASVTGSSGTISFTQFNKYQYQTYY